MQLFSLNKNSIALLFVVAITLGFFIGGLLGVLDYFIIKALLFSSFILLVFVAVNFALKNYTKKNRLEDKIQSDSH
ncbi:hypothetical protein [Winogradskyella sp. PG-2]|uniref:hypothetical protein n=1 Tax=Winogradskyella sp. PG-2 TaxID=754409 RepID=UPI0004586DA1|nr:hypothetical protein [Winogradskyella sp. PG-2]BAO76843.1 hypothetical protein WPG_2613 [Winogradskyella sp. PG-2]